MDELILVEKLILEKIKWKSGRKKKEKEKGGHTRV